MTNPANPQSQTLPVPVPNPSGQPPSSGFLPLPEVSQERSAEEVALAKFSSDQPSFVTSLPMVTPEDFERVSALMAVSDAKSKNCANTTIAVVGFAVDFGVVGENADGEIVEGLRGHVLTDDGKSIFTTSSGLLKALRDGVKIFGRGLWAPPAILEIRQVPSKRGDALIGIWRGRKGGKEKVKK